MKLFACLVPPVGLMFAAPALAQDASADLPALCTAHAHAGHAMPMDPGPIGSGNAMGGRAADDPGH